MQRKSVSAWPAARLLIATVTCICALQGVAQAASPSATQPNVPIAWGHAVANLNKTVSFYHDLLGMELVRPVPKKPHLAPAYARLTGLPKKTEIRTALVRVPNQSYVFELVEYSHVRRADVWANHRDPGAAALTLTTLDTTSLFAELRAAGTPDIILAK